MNADLDGALRIANLAADYDWLWTAENAESFCRLAQFQIDQRHPELAALQTSLCVNPHTGFMMSSRKLLASAGRPSQSVVQLSVQITDSGDESSPSLHKSLVDLFADLSGSFIAEFGSPTRWSPGEYAEIGWDFDEFTMLLTTSDSSIGLGLVNPAYLRWWGEVDDESEDESDDDEYEDDEDDEEFAGPGGQLTWIERRDALLAAVTRLPNNVELVLTTPGGSTIAFTVAEAQLTSRTESGPDRRGQSRHDHDWFVAHGWNLNSGSPEGWARSVPWPARYNEYEKVVDAAILVLRGPLEVENPNEITVEAL